MSTQNRAAILAKIHKVAKKHFKPVEPVSTRSVLEHLLYACALENSKYQDADDAFAKLQQAYFDWNEVRVTTVAELAETLGNLPHPSAAANNVKRSLQGLFEAMFSYDLEFMKKQNLGKSEQDLAKYIGDAPFIVSYVAQHGLGGHSIPCGQAELDLLFVLGALTESEFDKRQVPGMERAIPKNKGVEFASLFHQLAADFFTSPNSTKVKAILFEVDPDAKERLTKLAQKKLAPPPVQVSKSKEAMENEKLQQATAKAKELAEKHRAQKAEAQEKKKSEAAPIPASMKPSKLEPPKSSHTKSEAAKRLEGPKRKEEKQVPPKTPAPEAKKPAVQGHGPVKKADPKKLAKKKPR